MAKKNPITGNSIYDTLSGRKKKQNNFQAANQFQTAAPQQSLAPPKPTTKSDAILKSNREFAPGTPKGVIKAARQGVPIRAMYDTKQEALDATAQAEQALAANPQFDPAYQAGAAGRQEIAAGVGQNIPILPGTAPSYGDLLRGAAPDIGAAGGLAAGAAAVASVTGIGTVVLAGAALLKSGQIVSNLKQEYQEVKTNEYTRFVGAKNGLSAIINQVNQGMLDPSQAVTLFNMELARIDRAERILAGADEKEWLGKNRKELIKIESFNRNERTSQVILLQQAIIQRDPSKVIEIISEPDAPSVL